MSETKPSQQMMDRWNRLVKTSTDRFWKRSEGKTPYETSRTFLKAVAEITEVGLSGDPHPYFPLVIAGKLSAFIRVVDDDFHARAEKEAKVAKALAKGAKKK